MKIIKNDRWQGPSASVLCLLMMKAAFLTACGGSSSSPNLVVDEELNEVVEEQPQEPAFEPLAKRSGWQDFIIDPVGEFVYPQEVTVVGEPTAAINPDAIKHADGNCSTISTDALGVYVNQNRLDIDLSINTGGYVEIGMCGSTAPLRVSYAERREWLNPDGDFSGDNIGKDGNPQARAHTVPVGETGEIRFPGIQGAQRWMTLILEGPGTASIDYIRIKHEHLTATEEDYTSYFYASDDLLNTIWFQSAYTMNLVALQDQVRGGNRVYVDGAKRDRMVWLGDLGNQGLSAYYSHREGVQIMKDTLAMFGCQQFSNGYLPMFSQIFITCDPLNPGEPNGPVQHGLEPLEELGRLGEYTAWWVIGLADYFLYTGDDEFTRAQLPVARRTVDYFESKSNGGVYCTGQIGAETPSPAVTSLLGPLGGVIQSTFDLFTVVGQTTGACLPLYPGEINWHPFDLSSGEEMHVNAVIYRSYIRLAELERLVGDGEDAAQRLEALAETRRLAMLDTFWDDSAGAFIGNSFNPQVNRTQDGNVEALLSGIVRDDQAERVLTFLDEHLQGPFGTLMGELDNDPFMSRVYAPFVGSREIVARFDNYDTSGAMNQIRKLWGHMATHDPASTVWERVGQDGNIPAYNIRVDFGGQPSLARPPAGFTSAAHGWGAGPINALTGYVAGIRPLSPGFDTWIVEPQLADLEWAQGQIVTPHGTIESRWQRDESDFILTVVAPQSAHGRVGVPMFNDPEREVMMNGEKVWPNENGIGVYSEDTDYVYFDNINQDVTFQIPL